jgi:hypothetical protein
VASLDAPAAVPTTTDGDVEPSDDWLLGDLFLGLRQRLIQDRVPAALAVIGKRHGDDLVDVIGNRAMRFGSVVPAGLSPARFGIGFRITLGEGGRLAPLGTKGFVKLLEDFSELSLKFGDAALELGDLGRLLAKLGVLPTQIVEFLVSSLVRFLVSHSFRVSPEIQHQRAICVEPMESTEHTSRCK